jgi:poly(3-hydroxybutyrate) depolymerase
MSMNLEKHQEAHMRYLQQLMDGDGDSAEKHLEFYDEYLAALDLTEEFYLQTVDVVFQRYLLPKGELEHRGRLVKPELIADIALLTVEGENDDISGIGQTQAAHALCSGIPAQMKHDYVQPVVGHYGVFNGKRFREEIYPRVRALIWETELAIGRATAANPLPKSTKAA